MRCPCFDALQRGQTVTIAVFIISDIPYECTRLLIGSSSHGSSGTDEWQWVWCDGSCVVIIRDESSILACFMALVGSN